MRIATIRGPRGVGLAVLRNGKLLDLGEAARLTRTNEPGNAFHDMLSLITGGPRGLEIVTHLVSHAPTSAELATDKVEFYAPIPRLSKNMFCLGRNYPEHAHEMLHAIGEDIRLTSRPNIFTKATTAITGPYSDIPIDQSVSTQLDWEPELGVVIGRTAKHVLRQDAIRYVWGYTIVNDVSARDIQSLAGVQWFMGKNLDRSSPMGPWIVTADEIPDPQDLHIHLSVNGIQKQHETTAHMIYDVSTIIEFLTHILTLEAGDVISTGTPGGVGFARRPPEFLVAGDLMETSITEIGALRNRVVSVTPQFQNRISGQPDEVRNAVTLHSNADPFTATK